jgi:hypothetical protein
MADRQLIIARSIIYAILGTDENGKPTNKSTVFGRFLGRFWVYWLTFQLVRADLFRALRGFWAIKDKDYKASFGTIWKDAAKRKDILETLGDMGYSGSTFYRTHDGAYLVKSVPRYFEHTFFKNEMLIPYADHMRANPESLLIRITDFLECSQRSFGSLFGMSPSHHIVMENVLYGSDKENEDGSKSVSSMNSQSRVRGPRKIQMLMCVCHIVEVGVMGSQANVLLLPRTRRGRWCAHFRGHQVKACRRV